MHYEYLVQVKDLNLIIFVMVCPYSSIIRHWYSCIKTLFHSKCNLSYYAV